MMGGLHPRWALKWLDLSVSRQSESARDDWTPAEAQALSPLRRLGRLPVCAELPFGLLSLSHRPSLTSHEGWAMRERKQTKGQLITELAALRQRIALLETSETTGQRAEETLEKSEQRYRKIFGLLSRDRESSEQFVRHNLGFYKIKTQ